MIVNLSHTLPPSVRPHCTRSSISLIERSRNFTVLPEDLALARIPDSQGLGGSTDTNVAEAGHF